MKTYSHLQIGEHHINHCEDFFVTAQLTDQQWLFAVMDGCTMGTDSYLPATITGKLLRKISKDFFYRSFINRNSNSRVSLKDIMHRLCQELKFINNYLLLNRDECLNTLLLGILDTQSQHLEGIAIGDGMMCVDGEMTIWEQDNKPDYLGYHLNEPFEDWWTAQTQFFSHQNVQDFSLATDGIFTFSRFINQPAVASIDVLDYLLVDATYRESENMLHRKMLQIRDEHALKPTDDLAVIRVILS